MCMCMCTYACVHVCVQVLLLGAVVLHLRARQRADRAPRRRAAREVDLDNVSVLDEGAARDRAEAGAHVDRPRRRARLGEGARQLDHRDNVCDGGPALLQVLRSL